MPRTSFGTLVGATCAAALLLPATAGASQLSMDGSTLVLQAGAGETNAVRLSSDFMSTGKLAITDSAGFTSVPDICEVEVNTTYACAAAGITAVRLDLGDGNDALDVFSDAPAGKAITVNAGPGDDDLSGGTYDTPMVLRGDEGNDLVQASIASDTLDGGAGNDDLDGGSGGDTVLGGDGDDKVAGDAVQRAADVIDGGNGTDTLADIWSNQPRTDVSLDGIANDGPPGEGDNITNVEIHRPNVVTRFSAGATPVVVEVMQSGAGSSELNGSPGPDRLRTYDYADTIRGGAGNDDIEAGNGDDTIDPGPGEDTVNAGPGSGSCNFLVCRGQFGNDTILARDGERDSIECGAGTDRVVADAIDTVAASCETVDRGAPTAPPAGGGTTPRGGGGKSVRCVVPKVGRGARLATTRTKLTRAKCKVTTVRVRSKVRKGRVVGLKIKKGKRLKAVKAGTRLAGGATIVVTISRGRR